MSGAWVRLRRVWLAVLVAVAACGGSGCDRGEPIDTSLATAPDLPAEVQGAWRFDRARTLEAWRQTLRPELLEQQMRFVAMIDGYEQPIHSDLLVNGAAVIGQSETGGLEPQYDFTEWGRDGGVIRGNAWWHEDRRDAGDRTRQTLSLRLEGDVLWLGFGDGSEGTLWLLFERGG